MNIQQVRYIVDLDVHSHEVRYPLNFVCEDKTRRLPPVVVYDNTCYEDQLKHGERIRIGEPIHDSLQVVCRSDRGKEEVRFGISEALNAHLFFVYEVEIGDFEINPNRL